MISLGILTRLLWEYPSLWPCSDNSWGLFPGHSLCEGAGSALGEDDTPEIITRVIKCSAGVSGTPAQGCTQEREGKKPRPGTTGADEPKGEAQTFSKERWGVDSCGKIGCRSKLGSRVGSCEWEMDFRNEWKWSMQLLGTSLRQVA